MFGWSLFSLPFSLFCEKNSSLFQMVSEAFSSSTPECVISMSHFMPNCMPVPDYCAASQTDPKTIIQQ